MISSKTLFIYSFLSLCTLACSDSDDSTSTETVTTSNPSEYTGTASLTQGAATVTTTNLFSAGGRISPLGTITALDNTVWTVPADVNFSSSSFPNSSDLHNPHGNTYNNTSEALNALDGSDIIEIDANGEVVTAFIFADNYFEMYINGVAVGKDLVPFTQFNSSIVRFKVNRPFSIAILAVDWEENSGLGTESNQGFAHHPGDGGLVAVFKDSNSSIIATTGSEWKAQTFYTAPIQDLSCPTESGTIRSSSSCSTSGTSDASSFYALHWPIPSDWTLASFDDSTWPSATTYTNATIGVDNKSAYTNFTDLFDDSNNDAEFIWSTNVVLDNEVILRYVVQ